MKPQQQPGQKPQNPSKGQPQHGGDKPSNPQHPNKWEKKDGGCGSSCNK